MLASAPPRGIPQPPSVTGGSRTAGGRFKKPPNTPLQYAAASSSAVANAGATPSGPASGAAAPAPKDAEAENRARVNGWMASLPAQPTSLEKAAREQAQGKIEKIEAAAAPEPAPVAAVATAVPVAALCSVVSLMPAPGERHPIDAEVHATKAKLATLEAAVIAAEAAKTAHILGLQKDLASLAGDTLDLRNERDVLQEMVRVNINHLYKVCCCKKKAALTAINTQKPEVGILRAEWEKYIDNEANIDPAQVEVFDAKFKATLEAMKCLRLRDDGWYPIWENMNFDQHLKCLALLSARPKPRPERFFGLVHCPRPNLHCESWPLPCTAAVWPG